MPIIINDIGSLLELKGYSGFIQDSSGMDLALIDNGVVVEVFSGTSSSVNLLTDDNMSLLTEGGDFLLLDGEL